MLFRLGAKEFEKHAGKKTASDSQAHCENNDPVLKHG